jgi:trimeric autotransporter adhesin
MRLTCTNNLPVSNVFQGCFSEDFHIKFITCQEDKIMKLVRRTVWLYLTMIFVLVGGLAMQPLNATQAAQDAISDDEAYLQVVHLAPFAPDATVTVTVNGTPTIFDFQYGDSTQYINLPAGSYLVGVVPSGATDPAISATIDLVAGTYYTAVAVGDGVNQDLDLILLEDDLSTPAAGKFHLRLGHLAPFAPGAATADVRLFDGTPVLENVNFGEVTGFISLDAGTYDLIITTPGGGTTLIDLAPVTFEEGTIISAFVSGEGVNQALGTFALPAGEQGFFLPLANAHLQVAHLAPFAEDASVSISLNGAEALSGFGYGDSTGYISLAPGTYDIAVTPTGTMTPAIEATVNLERLLNYTAVAVGDGVNQDLDLILWRTT